MIRFFFILLIFWPMTSYTADAVEPIQSEESFFQEDKAATETLPESPEDNSDEEDLEADGELDADSDDDEDSESFAETSDEDPDPKTKKNAVKASPSQESAIARKSSQKKSKNRYFRANTEPRSVKRRVSHPNADRGLYLITKDREHYYKIKRSKKSGYSSLKIGNFDPKNLKNTDVDPQIRFDEAYDKTNNLTLIFDYEWKWWRGFGELSYKMGTGLYVATGNGRFKSAQNAGLTPPENFTLVAFPNNVGLVYRLKYWDKQTLIPYIDGGLDLITFSEIREDSSPKFAAAYAGHAAAGLSFSLSQFSKLGMIDLDREYGVNDIQFTLEYRFLAQLGGRFDFGGSIVSGGVTAEY